MVRILIADDEVKVRQLIRLLLQDELHALEIVAEASNGRDALRLIAECRPHIVITDIRMPGGDGLDLIRTAKERHPGVHFIIISGYKQFEYAKKAIKFGVEDYLLKPLKKEELLATISGIIQKRDTIDAARSQQKRLETQLHQDARLLRMGLLQDLADGVYHSAPLTEAIAREHKLRAGPGMLVAIVKSDVPQAAENEHLLALLSKKQNDLIHSGLVKASPDTVVYSCGSESYLLCYGEQGEEVLQKSLRKLIASMRAMCDVFEDIHTTAALGKPVDTLRDLPYSLGCARFTIRNRLLAGVDRVLDAQIPAQIYSDGDLPAFTQGKRLLQTCEQLLAEELQKKIIDIGWSVISSPGCTGDLVLRVAEDLLEQVLFSMKNRYPGSELEAYRQDCRLLLSMCSTAEGVFSALALFGARFIRESAVRIEQKSRKPVLEAQQYIRTHYDQSITLEEVAESQGFNPSYFSSLFKRETGQGFMEFLTDIRIQAACDLLMNSGQVVGDIAQAVGYSDVKYFSKLFKKLTGLSPKEYRKLYY